MKMDRLGNYRRFTRNVRFLFIISGAWPLSKNSSFGLKVLFVLSVLSTFVCGSAALNFCYHHISSISAFTSGISLSGSLLTASLKIICFFVHRRYVRELGESLGKLFEEDLKDPVLQTKLLSLLPYFRKPVYTFTILEGIFISITVVSPFFIMAKYHKFVMPLPTRYPWTFELGGIFYVFHFTLEVAAVIFLWISTASVDAVFCMYVLQICSQLRTLGHKFKQLKSGCDYDLAIRKNIKKHCILIKQKDYLRLTFELIIIWSYITSAIIICCVMFQISQVEQLNVVKVFRLIVYVGIKLVQIFVYAWCGNLITTESYSCLKESYNCAWAATGNIRMMRDILLIITQRPLTIKAVGLLVVSLDMLTAVVNGSASYFFLLQTFVD